MPLKKKRREKEHCGTLREKKKETALKERKRAERDEREERKKKNSERRKKREGRIDNRFKSRPSHIHQTNVRIGAICLKFSLHSTIPSRSN